MAIQLPQSPPRTTNSAAPRTRLAMDDGLKTGLRNFWYPLLRSRDLRATPVGIRRLNQDLVLWRDQSGAPHLFPDRCPHRGAQLSIGRIQGDLLACWYHGFEFAGNGECKSVPVEGVESRLLTRLKMPSYPVEEHNGLIWGFIGEQELFPVPPLVLPYELTHPEWSGFLCQATWPANWLLILDNQVDPMHGPFLHSKSFTLSKGLKFDRLHTRQVEGGFVVERELQRGVNLDWAEMQMGSMLYWRLDIPLPSTAGPGGPMRIIGWSVPIDEDSSMFVVYRLRKISGWQRTLWRGLYRTFWEAQHWKVIEQDRVMLESQRGLESRLFEHMAQTDVGIAHLRGRINREYQRQQDVYRQAAAGGRLRNPAAVDIEEDQPLEQGGE